MNPIYLTIKRALPPRLKWKIQVLVLRYKLFWGYYWHVLNLYFRTIRLGALFFLFRSKLIALDGPSIDRLLQFYKTLNTYRPSSKYQERMTYLQTALAPLASLKLEFFGWTFHPTLFSRPQTVFILIHGQIVQTCTKFYRRPDVANYYKKKCPTRIGFQFSFSELDIEQLPTLQVYAQSKDGNLWQVPLHAEMAERGLLGVEASTFQSYTVNQKPSGFVDRIIIHHIENWSQEEIHKLPSAPNGFQKHLIKTYLTATFKFKTKDMDTCRILTTKLGKNWFVDTLDVIDPTKNTKIAGERHGHGGYEDFIFSLPRIFPSRMSPKRDQKVFVPPEDLYEVHNAHVLFNSIVLDGKGESKHYFAYDPSGHPGFEFVAGLWNTMFRAGDHKCGVLVNYEKLMELDEAILIDGRCSTNYFHWLIEYLPRMKTLEAFPNLASVPIIANQAMPKTCKEALEIIAPGRPVIWNQPKNWLQVKRLYIPSMHTFHPDSLQLDFPAGSALSIAHLDYLRTKVFASMGDVPYQTRQIFLKRPSALARGILNYQEIEDIARLRGFELVDPSQLSFLDQARLFASSKVVVGAGGAALSNLVFCQPGTKVISFISEQNKNYSMQANLGHYAGADVLLITGKSPMPPEFYESRYSYMHAPYSISSKEFKGALNYAHS